MVCAGLKNLRPRVRSRVYVVSRGCSETQRDIVDGEACRPNREEIFSAVSWSVKPRSKSVIASRISSVGYVLFRIGRGPGVNVRPHDLQRQSGTLSGFFFPVPSWIGAGSCRPGPARGLLGDT